MCTNTEIPCDRRVLENAEVRWYICTCTSCENPAACAVDIVESKWASMIRQRYSHTFYHVSAYIAWNRVCRPIRDPRARTSLRSVSGITMQRARVSRRVGAEKGVYHSFLPSPFPGNDRNRSLPQLEAKESRLASFPFARHLSNLSRSRVRARERHAAEARERAFRLCDARARARVPNSSIIKSLHVSSTGDFAINSVCALNLW